MKFITGGGFGGGGLDPFALVAVFAVVAVAVLLLTVVPVRRVLQWVRRQGWQLFDQDDKHIVAVAVAAVALGFAIEWIQPWLGKAEALSIRQTIIPDFDGQFRTSCPLGNCAPETITPPTLGPITAVGDDTLVLTLLTAASGGTAPYTYKIEQGPDPSNFTQIASAADIWDDEIHSVTGLTAETEYCFRMRVTDSAGSPVTSDYSPTLCKTTGASSADVTAPTQPMNVTISDVESDRATCSWDASTDAVGVVGYDVYRGEGNGSGSAVSGTSVQVGFLNPTTSIDLTNLDSEQEYYCRVEARDAAGNRSTASAREFFTTDAEGTPPTGNIIFRETWESFPLLAHGSANTAYIVPGRWTTATDGGTRSISNSSPVSSGFGKYYEARVIRDEPITETSNNYRSELIHTGAPNGPQLIPLLDAGGGHRYETTSYYHGYVWCLDAYTANPASFVHVNQFHTRGGYQHDPMISLFTNGQEVKVYIEENYEGGGLNNQQNYVSANLWDDPLGSCLRIVWQIRWDSRQSNNNSTGMIRLWIGTMSSMSSTPKFEWLNKSVGFRVDTGEIDGYRPWLTHGCYCSIWRFIGQGSLNQEYRARFDNYAVMDDSGSIEAMAAALLDPD